jgi:RsiW-degrading membrane proteinase PrsW (M82 family)
VLSTLLPHLGRSRLSAYRAAGVAGLGALLVVTALGYPGVGLAGAAVLVPALFLIYLREVEIYRREPLGVLVRSFGWGLLVGLVLTGAANYLVGSAPGEGLDAFQVAVFTVVVPLLAAVLTPLMLLSLRRRYVQTVDGLSFGIAAGLGYALAETAVNFAPLISAAGARVDAQTWVLTVLSAGILVPLVHGSTVGAVAGSWWRLRLGSRRDVPLIVLIAAPLASVCFALGSDVLAGFGAPGWAITLWQVFIAALLLVTVRVLLHDALLDEAHAMGLTERLCPQCGVVVEAAGFCPRCGVAFAASPRR